MPSLLWAEQAQLSQPIFIGEVLQPSEHIVGGTVLKSVIPLVFRRF